MSFLEQAQTYFSKLVAFIKLVFNTINKYWQPVKNKLNEWLEPVYAIFRPIRDKISPIFDPIRRFWASFSQRFPTVAHYLSMLGMVIRRGFQTLVVLTIMIWIGFFGRSPSSYSLKHIHTETATEVYSADSVMLGRYYKYFNRKEISFKEISPNVVNALIAEEDSRFYSHHGIDFRAWARVIVKTVLLSENQGGGSTISQQLAKNLFPRKHFWFESRIWGLRFVTGKISTLINKIQEIILAVRLENNYEKEELLTLYLNTVPFSGYVYGIDMASKRFFNSNAKDLTPEKAALLVGMLKATNEYDPTKFPDKAKSRRNAVLRSMVEMENISQKECDKYSAMPITLDYVPESFSEGSATYFRESLRQEVVEILKNKVKKEDGSSYDLYADGLRVITTIDSRMQEHAEAAVQEQMKKVQKNFFSDWKHADEKKKPWNNDTLWRYGEMPKTKRYQTLKANGFTDEQIFANFNTKVKMVVFDWESPNHEKAVEMTPADSLKYYLQLINAGFLAMDSKTGAIKAWVGGIDHHFFKIDHIKTKRQVGSTFKPIVYASAIQRGISPCTYFGNYQKMYHFRGEDWEPGNSDDEYGGSYSMMGALRKSLNVISVKLILQKTPEIKPDKIDAESGNLLIEKAKTGIDETVALAKKMGITSEIKDVPSIALGTVDIKLLDMMSVYGTFANRGMRPNIHYLDKILDNQGRVIYDQKEMDKKANKVSERALTEDEADIMTKMLESVVDDGTGSNIREIFDIRGDIAGKTGTTQDHADAWFMCFTPDLVCGAWAGAEIPKVHFRTIDYGQGSKAALPMCGSFLAKVFADPKFRRLATTQFPEPKPEITSLVECDNYVRDSTYTDSLGVRHAVQGSGVKRMFEEEKLLEEAGLEAPNPAGTTPKTDPSKDTKDKPKKKEPDDKEIEKLMKEGTDVGESSGDDLLEPVFLKREGVRRRYSVGNVLT